MSHVLQNVTLLPMYQNRTSCILISFTTILVFITSHVLNALSPVLFFLFSSMNYYTSCCQSVKTEDYVDESKYLCGMFHTNRDY